MKTGVVVAEFNPFHNGHAYLIEKARESGITHVVAVMSGNFVQRGEPAICDTSLRTLAALNGGVDLVIQLPVARALSGAKGFAAGAVEISQAMGIVDSLVFGSECGNSDLLLKAAELEVSGKADEKIKDYLSTGITYASAREKAFADIDENLAEIIRMPNNILAVEYISALLKGGSKTELFTVPREGASHDSSDKKGRFAGAKEIRRMIYSNEVFSDYVPDYSVYDGKINSVNPYRFESNVLCRMRTMSAEDIARSPDISEGIENRIYAASREATSLEELYSIAKTKRYTHARIRRIVMNCVLGITKEDAEMPAQYIRILGMNDRGAELIRAMKDKATLPIISKTADFKGLPIQAQKMFDNECVAADIRSACLEKPLPCGLEKDFKLIKI